MREGICQLLNSDKGSEESFCVIIIVGFRDEAPVCLPSPMYFFLGAKKL